MNFDGFYGNERAKQYISSVFARGAVPHALLLCGERSIGKKTFAKIIARAIVCSGENPPCSECSSCYKAEKGIHPDIIFLGSEDTSIKVDEIRNLKRDALLRPNDAEKKVYIISSAGAMTHEAQDALLKILEEPPSFTHFILLCESSSDLLPTIVSRACSITLSPLCDDDMMKIIKETKPELSADEASELLRTSGGICSFLCEETASDTESLSSALLDALASKDEFRIFRACAALEKLSRDKLTAVANEVTLALRDCLILASGANSRLLSSAGRGSLDTLSRKYSERELLGLLELLRDAKASVSRNVGVSHITGTLTCKFADIAANAASKG